MPSPAADAVTTRPATVADVAPLHSVINMAYRSDKNWTNESELVKDDRIAIEELEAQILAGVDPILIAELNDEVVGCIQIECTRARALLWMGVSDYNALVRC